MIDGVSIVVILLLIFAFLIGYLIGCEPTYERCPKCNGIVDTEYEHGPTYLIKKCRCCKWKSKKKEE